MAITPDWSTLTFSVPQADLTLVTGSLYINKSRYWVLNNNRRSVDVINCRRVPAFQNVDRDCITATKINPHIIRVISKFNVTKIVGYISCSF